MEEILFRVLVSISGATLIFGGMIGYVLIKIQKEN